MSTIEIILPFLPKTANQLNPLHWAVRSKHLKEIKRVTTLIAARSRPIEPFKAVRIHFKRCSSRATDLDNIIGSCKPILDGLKQAGIIEDDKPSVVREISASWEKVPRKDVCMKITIVPLE